MDGDDGLLVVGVDGLKGLVLDALDELAIDEPVRVSTVPYWAPRAGRSVAENTYSPVGCSYLSVGVVMVEKRVEDMMGN